MGVDIPVYLPTINKSVAQWNFKDSLYLSTYWGWTQNYTTQFNGHTINLELTHLNDPRPISGFTTMGSGAQVSTTYAGTANHLHVGVVVDGIPFDPLTDLSMCTEN